MVIDRFHLTAQRMRQRHPTDLTGRGRGLRRPGSKGCAKAVLQGGQQRTASNANTGGNEKGGAGKGNAQVTFGNESPPREIPFAAQNPGGKEGTQGANDARNDQNMKPGDGITSVNTDSSPRGMPQD